MTELSPSSFPARPADAPQPGALSEPLGRPHHSPWLDVLAAVLIVASLLGPLAAVGVWDPYELRVAELARRFAVNFFPGAEALALEDVSNAMPTRGELARGELPFTSIALGFRLFGLYTWAGRLPLAVWGLAGAAATYWLVARLASRTAAALSVIVLATLPLYFLQARTMLGDIVTMAAFAGACAGFGVAAFDRREGTPFSGARIAGLLLGAGSLVAGFLARGLLFGVAAPLLAVGVSFVVQRTSSSLRRDIFGDSIAASCLIGGCAAGYAGVRVLAQQLAELERYYWWLGFSAQPSRTLPTFDAVLLQLGHALYPWSAVLPVALAWLWMRRPDARLPADDRERRWQSLCTLVFVGPAVGYALWSLLAPVAGVLPFAPVPLLAVACALGLLTFDRSGAASRTAGMLAGALAIVLLVDFETFSDKALSAFVVADAQVPESFRQEGMRWLKYPSLLFIGLFALATFENGAATRRAFDKADYVAWIKTVRELWNGNLLFGLMALEAALIGFVAIDLIADRVPSLREYLVLGGLGRSVARVGWLALPALVLSPLVVMAARDALRALDGLPRDSGPYRFVPTRGGLAVLSAAAVGLLLSLVYYPKFGAHVSPKQAFAAYGEHAKAGEALAMVGSSAGAASYYAGGNVSTFASASEAFEWMMNGAARRWLVLRNEDLATLNSQYRARTKPPRNLPVLDATSSEVLLVSNRLEGGEVSRNPLDSIVLSQAPQPAQRVDVNLGGQLDVLGWQVTTLEGERVTSVKPSQRYRFSIYYRVTGASSGAWETFIHIDGFQRRFNGDHQTFGGKYPFHLLRVGDFLADHYEFALEPNFTPGSYRVYFGLFTGSRRMDVTRGRHDDNRIEAGTLVVE